MENTPDLTPYGIRERAIAARVSINRLMQRAGVANSTLHRWQNGETSPSAVTVGKIKDALEWFERDYAERIGK